MDCCPPKMEIAQRRLLTEVQGRDLAKVFAILSNATRLRLLHALVRTGEMCMTELAERVTMKPQAVSNQLRSLVHQGILGDRREGSRVYYRIVDPCVPVLLDQGMCLVEDARGRSGRKRSKG